MPSWRQEWWQRVSTFSILLHRGLLQPLSGLPLHRKELSQPLWMRIKMSEAPKIAVRRRGSNITVGQRLSSVRACSVCAVIYPKHKVSSLGLKPSVEMTELLNLMRAEVLILLARPWKKKKGGLNAKCLNITPPIAFAWGVLGSAIGGYFSPYSPCCFQEYLFQSKPWRLKKSRSFTNFFELFSSACATGSCLTQV